MNEKEIFIKAVTRCIDVQGYFIVSSTNQRKIGDVIPGVNIGVQMIQPFSIIGEATQDEYTKQYTLIKDLGYFDDSRDPKYQFFYKLVTD